MYSFILHVPGSSVLLLVLFLRMDYQEEYMVEIDPSRKSYLNNRKDTSRIHILLHKSADCGFRRFFLLGEV